MLKVTKLQRWGTDEQSPRAGDWDMGGLEAALRDCVKEPCDDETSHLLLWWF